jgi:hypothetical protein
VHGSELVGREIAVNIAPDRQRSAPHPAGGRGGGGLSVGGGKGVAAAALTELEAAAVEAEMTRAAEVVA